MAGLKVFKELELPSIDNIQLNSIYLIGNSNSSHVDIYITGNTPGIIKRVRNEEDINDLIDNKLSNFSLSDPIVFAGTLDLNIVNTGPTRLNSLFIVQNDYNEFKQNDLLLKISDTSPYFVKLNNSGSNSNNINVIEWNPYNEGESPVELKPSNSRTGFDQTAGRIFKIDTNPIELFPYNIGVPNHPAIEITNGSNDPKINTRLHIDKSNISSGAILSGYCIKNFTSFNILPLSTYYDSTASTDKGLSVTIILIQVEENEDISDLKITDILNKPCIVIEISAIYSNNYNTYSKYSFAIKQSGSSGDSYINESYYLYGSYGLNIKIDNDKYSSDYNSTVLEESWGFSKTKKWAAVGAIQYINNSDIVDPDPIDFEIYESDDSIILSSTLINEGIISIKEYGNVSFVLSEYNMNDGSPFIMAGSTERDGTLVYSRDGVVELTSDYIDPITKDITFKINNTDNEKNISVLNVINSQYEEFITFNETLNYVFINAEQASDEILEWDINIIKWTKIGEINGIIPNNVKDGDYLKILQNGLYNNFRLLRDDCIQLYDNKNKFILVRNTEVSNNVNTANNNAVSGNAVKAYIPSLDYISNNSNSLYKNDNNSLDVKISNNSNNVLYSDSSGLYVAGFNPNNSTLTGYTRLHGIFERYAVLYLYGGSSLNIDVSDIVNIYEITVYTNTVYIYINGTAISNNIGDNIGAYGDNPYYSRVITLIFKNLSSNVTIQWPSQFVFQNDELPELENGKVLVVNALIYNQRDNPNNTGSKGKYMCTFSTYEGI